MALRSSSTALVGLLWSELLWAELPRLRTRTLITQHTHTQTQVTDALHALRGNLCAIVRLHPTAVHSAPRRLQGTGAAAVAAALAPFALAGLQRRRLTAFAAHFSSPRSPYDDHDDVRSSADARAGASASASGGGSGAGAGGFALQAMAVAVQDVLRAQVPQPYPGLERIRLRIGGFNSEISPTLPLP